MLPFVLINVATTVDGKLAPASRRFVSFGSRRDQLHLLELRATADAVMAGARTVDLMPVNLGPGPDKFRRLRVKRGLAESNLRVVVSGRATLDPRAEIFQHRFSPIIVLTSARAPQDRVSRLRKVADEVEAFGDPHLDFRGALAWLRQQWGVKRLVCEGGGEVNEGLFRAGAVDEIHVTFCPFVFGGRHAPTMADGCGIQEVTQAVALRLRSLKRAAQELFLVYAVQKKQRGFLQPNRPKRKS